MSKFMALPDDILLLICKPWYMPWHTALSLTFVHPRFRSLNLYKNQTEEDWRLLLYQYGLGKSLLDSRAGRTWKELARAIAYHSGRCRLCGQFLRPSGMLGDAEEAVISSQRDARSSQNQEIIGARRWESKFVPKRKEDSLLVTFVAHEGHTARGQLIPEAMADCLTSPLNGIQQNRLCNHIVLSSLFLTEIPVKELEYEVLDDVYSREQPPRAQTVCTRDERIENDSGVTVLDAVMSMTDWEDYSDLLPGEVLRFAGLEWDPLEYSSGMPGHTDIWEPEIKVRYE